MLENSTPKNASPEKAAFEIATPKNASPQNGTSKNVSPRIDTLEALVRALCADYPRRQEEIEKSELSPRVLMEYKYFNVLIFRAVAEVVGELEAMLYIEDIGERRGYSKRLDLFISENTYDKRKRQCKINIARALKLADW